MAGRHVSWTDYSVQFTIRVSAHDESGVDVDHLVDRLRKYGDLRLQEMIETMGDFEEGVEVEVA